MRASLFVLPVLLVTLIEPTGAQPSPAGAVGAAKKQPAKEAPLITEAREAVKLTLKDPFAAVFQNVRSIETVNLKGKPMQVVCGEVNAKNSYGGFTRWIYDVDTRSAFVLGGRDNIVATEMIANFCR